MVADELVKVARDYSNAIVAAVEAGQRFGVMQLALAELRDHLQRPATKALMGEE